MPQMLHTKHGFAELKATARLSNILCDRTREEGSLDVKIDFEIYALEVCAHLKMRSTNH